MMPEDLQAPTGAVQSAQRMPGLSAEPPFNRPPAVALGNILIGLIVLKNST